MTEILEQLNNLKELGYIQKAHLNVLEVALEDYKTEIRAKAIDEFALFMSNYIDENQYGCVDDLLYRPYTTMLEIAEQMKAGGKNE